MESHSSRSHCPQNTRASLTRFYSQTVSLLKGWSAPQTIIDFDQRLCEWCLFWFSWWPPLHLSVCVCPSAPHQSFPDLAFQPNRTGWFYLAESPTFLEYRLARISQPPHCERRLSATSCSSLSRGENRRVHSLSLLGFCCWAAMTGWSRERPG